MRKANDIDARLAVAITRLPPIGPIWRDEFVISTVDGEIRMVGAERTRVWIKVERLNIVPMETLRRIRVGFRRGYDESALTREPCGQDPPDVSRWRAVACAQVPWCRSPAWPWWCDLCRKNEPESLIDWLKCITQAHRNWLLKRAIADRAPDWLDELRLVLKAGNVGVEKVASALQARANSWS